MTACVVCRDGHLKVLTYTLPALPQSRCHPNSGARMCKMLRRGRKGVQTRDTTNEHSMLRVVESTYAVSCNEYIMDMILSVM